MAATILVVDDDPAISDLISIYLGNEGFNVLSADSGSPAVELASSSEVDLAILDVMLPDMNGFELCRRLREHHYFPIIMLTALGDESDRITGLTFGADDYVTKPFPPLELVARVKAQLRRSERYNRALAERTAHSSSSQTDRHSATVLIYGDLSLDVRAHLCTIRDRVIALTPKEFSLLQVLLENQGAVVSTSAIYRAVWDEEPLETASSTVAVHVRHLREKLGDSAQNPQYIATVWGVGYKIGSRTDA